MEMSHLQRSAKEGLVRREVAPRACVAGSGVRDSAGSGQARPGGLCLRPPGRATQLECVPVAGPQGAWPSSCSRRGEASEGAHSCAQCQGAAADLGVLSRGPHWGPEQACLRHCPGMWVPPESQGTSLPDRGPGPQGSPRADGCLSLALAQSPWDNMGHRAVPGRLPQDQQSLRRLGCHS